MTKNAKPRLFKNCSHVLQISECAPANSANLEGCFMKLTLVWRFRNFKTMKCKSVILLFAFKLLTIRTFAMISFTHTMNTKLYLWFSVGTYQTKTEVLILYVIVLLSQEKRICKTGLLFSPYRLETSRFSTNKLNSTYRSKRKKAAFLHTDERTGRSRVTSRRRLVICAGISTDTQRNESGDLCSFLNYWGLRNKCWFDKICYRL